MRDVPRNGPCALGATPRGPLQSPTRILFATNEALRCSGSNRTDVVVDESGAGGDRKSQVRHL